MADHKEDPVLDELDEFDEEERMLLESHIKKNQAAEPQKTSLYYLIAGVTVMSITYLFQTVIDLNFLEPINFVLFVVSGGVTAYFLAEAYTQMYETESLRAHGDAYGLWIKDLDQRRARKYDRIKNKSVVQTSVPSQVRTATDIFVATGKTADQWKSLDKAAKQEFIDQEAREECAILGAQVADLKHLQYQQCMGWSLFQCNALFVGVALVLSNVLLRSYDARVNYLVSTLVTGLVTQLYTKRNEDTKAKKN